MGEQTNDDVDPIFGTPWVEVPADHPLIEAMLAIWHVGDDGQSMYADDPMQDAAVAEFVHRLEALLAQSFKTSS
jgi:hypothetical protein